MKILLVNTIYGDVEEWAQDRNIMSLGILYLAAYLRKHNHEVFFVDPLTMGINSPALMTMVRKIKPALVGLNATTPTLKRAVKFAHLVKGVLQTKVILGGPHISALPSQTLAQFPVFDFACIGEGEETMIELLNNIYAGPEQFKNIRGLSYRHDGRILNNLTRAPLEDIDNLPYPARDLVDMRKYGTLFSIYHAKKGQSATMLTSRGCYHECSFCASRFIFGKRFRPHSPDYVVNEMKMLKSNYGVENIAIVDDAFTLDAQRVKDICQRMITERLDINWICQTRADCITQDMLTIMREAGCKMVSFGLDSGSAAVLGDMHKNITPETSLHAVKMVNSSGLKSIGNLMIGNHFETKEMIKDTMRYAIAADSFLMSFSINIPFPGSKYFPQDCDLKTINLGYFSFRSTGLYRKFPNLLGSHFSAGDLKMYVLKGYLCYYLRPRIILRIIKGITSWKGFLTKAFSFFIIRPLTLLLRNILNR